MGRRRAGHVRKKKRVRRKHTRYVQLVRVQHHTSRRRQPGTAGSSASKSGKNENTVLALFSHGYLPYSVVSDSKLLETSRGLGTGGPAARANRGQQRARGGESMERRTIFCLQSQKNTVPRPNFGRILRF